MNFEYCVLVAAEDEKVLALGVSVPQENFSVVGSGGDGGARGIEFKGADDALVAGEEHDWGFQARDALWLAVWT